MKVLIDGDGCPVIRETERACALFGIEVLILCDTSHLIHSETSRVILVDQGRDAADLALISRIRPGDVVITQDYGLAALALTEKAYAFHQDGWQYNEENIEGLLWQRYEAGKARRSSRNHMKGPPKRDKKQNELFFHKLCSFLKEKTEGT
ncbi:YaiI/YqxD family protein [Dialister sp.]|uniref:YaiI/YqxD family protein n=1 Tax=Dialister sp. TaxID=1955814 RepID=UPI003EFD8266